MKNKFIKISLVTACLMTNSTFAKESKSLDDLTVTAQKTEQNLQEIPTSISLFDDLTIEDRNINNVSDIVAYIPNFSFFHSAGLSGAMNPSLRGINSISADSSISVPLIIDGVALTSNVGYDLSLTDVERIEVLRGPQGTLYGAGAEAGLINIITKKPSNETVSKVGVELGSDNKQQYTFNASGAIIENKLFLGLAAKYYKKDGFIKDLSRGGYVNDEEYIYGKTNLRYLPSDNLEVALITSVFDRDDGGSNINNIGSPKEIYSNTEDNYTKSKDLSNSLKVAYDFDKYKLESITTHISQKLDFNQDFDFTDATVLHLAKKNKRKQLSQEFRVSNNDNEKLSFLAGIYADDKTDNWNISYDKTAGLTTADQDASSNSLGVFTNVKYNLTPKFGVTAGLRYDRSQKKLKVIANGNEFENDFSEFSPKLSLEYKLENNNLLYTTIAKGYSAGGFNVHIVDASRKNYDEEKLISYEIGLKSKLLDDRIRFNGSIYQMDIDNLQVKNFTNSSSFYITNAAKGTSRGLELELDAIINDSVNLFASYGLNSTKFDNFSDAKGDYNNNYKPYAPKYDYSIGGKYRDERGYFLRADLVGYGDMYLDNANNYKRDAFHLVNTKFGYESDSYEIYLYGNNIFDKDYSIQGYGDGKYVVYSKPREIGVQLVYRF